MNHTSPETRVMGLSDGVHLWARPRGAQLTAGPRSAASAARTLADLLIARLVPRLRWADGQTLRHDLPTGQPDSEPK